MPDQRTTENLREMLFDTIENLKSGKIDDRDALVISKLADNIIKTADIELKYAETVSRLDRDDQGISPGPLMLTNKS